MNINRGSFRDPAGQVFSKDGKFYRCIFEPGRKDYEAARSSGVYSKLIASGLLISHEEINATVLAPNAAIYCLQHPPIPFVSYPWEWAFSMLKDAALLHLDVMEEILPEGFWLRDASAFNVQYDGQRLRLIDTLSIGQRVPNSPWVAYGQFCAHFLAPLALAAYCDIRMLGLWRNYIDGYPLDLAVKMLPVWRLWSPGIFMHMFMHARLQSAADKKEDLGTVKPERTLTVSDRGLMGIIRSLRRTIHGIKWRRFSRIWEDYDHIRTYQPEDIELKSEYVSTVMHRLRPGIVWDLGANTGEFSLIAASAGAFVASIDSDPACTEHLYQRLSGADGRKRVLPLTMDLANPSPGLGWDSRERLSLRERGPADLILALALVHHLVLSNCVPLSRIADWLSDLARYALIEFVPPSDPMVQKLLRNHRGEHLPYGAEEFQSAFGMCFDFEDKRILKNGRTLYLWKSKR
jgi:hypothetical protein